MWVNDDSTDMASHIYTIPGLPFGLEAGCITDFAKHGNVSQPVSVAVMKYSHMVNIPSLARWGVATRD